MLKSLQIKNILIIDKLDLNFTSGLNVLTGETGAGKSILLDSLGLILGNRVDFSLIRKGENEASVVALFDVHDNHTVVQILNQYNIEFENELLIRRQISTNGKSKCFINDVLITRNALSEITDCLIELQGQFEDRGLLNIKTHLYLLDIFSNHNHLIETTKKSGPFSNITADQGLTMAQLGGVLMGARNMSELGTGIAGVASQAQDRRSASGLAGAQQAYYKSQAEQAKAEIEAMPEEQRIAKLKQYEAYAKLIQDGTVTLTPEELETFSSTYSLSFL